jgi:hypothetical protein
MYYCKQQLYCFLRHPATALFPARVPPLRRCTSCDTYQQVGKPAAQKQPNPIAQRAMRFLARRPYQWCQRLCGWLGLSALLVSLAGCGYTLVGATPGAAPRRLALAVSVFTNQTREPGVESQVTAALRRAVLQSPVFTLVDAEASVPRLQGIVRRFRTAAVSYDQNDTALQYRLEADILIRLTDGSSQVPVLEREISTWAEYLVSRSAQVGEGAVRENVVARDAALFQLAQRFADTCTALLIVTLL